MNSIREIAAQERRHSPRRKPNELIYISLLQGNGGIVLDVSEGGLGFHTVSPIDLAEPIAFRFSVASMGSVEALGKLAWRDGTGKSGGLQFTKLPDALHTQISLWLNRSSFASPHASTTAVPGEIEKIIPSQVTSRSESEVKEEFSSEAKPVVASKPRLITPKGIRHKLGLRTKMFLCAAVAAIALNYVMAVGARHFVQNQANEQLAADENQSTVAARAVFDQINAELARKADLLTTVASMAPANDSTMQASIENPLVNNGTDLMAFADAMNQVAALHTNDSSLTPVTAEALLLGSFHEGANSDWWFADGKLYQVALATVHHEPLGRDRSGTIIIGRRMDTKQVHDLADVLGSPVAFTYSGKIVASSFNSYDENELSQQLHPQSPLPEVQVGNNRYAVRTITLTDDTRPAVRLILLKSRAGADALQARESHQFRQLLETEFLIGIVLIAFALIALRRQS